jgi:hypothetical protein
MHKGLKRGVLALAAIACACTQRAPELTEAQSAAPDGEWVSLFNGRDLEGWTPKFTGSPLGENVLNTFRVEDGVLKVSYDEWDAFEWRYGHLFYTPREFSHYWLRVEYRFVGDQIAGAPDWAYNNNGVMFHAQPPETMTLDQEFPDSIEFRLLGSPNLGARIAARNRPREGRSCDDNAMCGGPFGRRPTGNVCTPQTSVLFAGERSDRQCLESSSPTYGGDQWVRAEIEVRGAEVVRHYINGELVMEYANLQLDEPRPWHPGIALDSGYIAIQAETHPTEFRKIEILELPE